MKKRMILFLVTSAFSTSLLYAQSGGFQSGTPPTPPTPAQMAQRQVDHLTQLLGLNTAQQALALSIFTTAITANEAAQVNLKSARQTLQKDIEATDPNTVTSHTPPGPPPSALIEGDVSKIIAIENTVALNNASAQALFYGTLTAPQQATYTASRNPGPGGFGGNPPHMGPGPQGFGRGPR